MPLKTLSPKNPSPKGPNSDLNMDLIGQDVIKVASKRPTRNLTVLAQTQKPSAPEKRRTQDFP